MKRLSRLRTKRIQCTCDISFNGKIHHVCCHCWYLHNERSCAFVVITIVKFSLNACMWVVLEGETTFLLKSITFLPFRIVSQWFKTFHLLFWSPNPPISSNFSVSTNETLDLMVESLVSMITFCFSFFLLPWVTMPAHLADCFIARPFSFGKNMTSVSSSSSFSR